MVYLAPAPSDAGSGAAGSVVLYDLLSMQQLQIINAHRTAIACLALNSAGDLLATASEKGTVIRVFSLPDGHMRFQFRRGSYSARICHLSFDRESTLLCVASDTDTVHLFQLAPRDDTPPTKPASFLDWRAGSLGNYLPSSLSEMWEPSRDFAWLKLPSSGARTMACVHRYVTPLTQHPPLGPRADRRRQLRYLHARPAERGRVSFGQTYVHLLT